MRAHPRTVEDEIVGTFSTDTAANHLEEGIGKLAGANETTGREERETQLALTRRDGAVDTWTTTYRGVATALEGLYRLGEEPELADRIRLTVRRASSPARRASGPASRAFGPAR